MFMPKNAMMSYTSKLGEENWLGNGLGTIDRDVRVASNSTRATTNRFSFIHMAHQRFPIQHNRNDKKYN